MMHAELAATVAPAPVMAHVVLAASAKSPALAPANVMALMVSAALPLLVTVTAIGALAVLCTVFGSVILPAGVMVTAGAAMPPVTENPPNNVAICPSGFVTATSRAGVVAALARMLILAVICVAEFKVHELTCIPAPKLQVAPLTK